MQPLADQLRPVSLEHIIGQEHLVGKDGIITQLLQKGNIPSMIFWGPPASGKTSLAHVLAHELEVDFVTINAVMEGKEQLKNIIRSAQSNDVFNRNTILFIDEIHRWNKAQQDALLPYVEKGSIVLIGATTENPSFSIIPALLSRCRVFVFNKPTVEHIVQSLRRAQAYLAQNQAKSLECSDDDLEYLAQMSDGDIRFALNTLEILYNLKQPKVTKKLIDQAGQRSLLYDKTGEEHYNLISAVHKSLRSSNATAGVYWICRMLASGEDPLYIARRLIRFASEDIGNINPNALLLANQTYLAVEKIGMPEGEVILVQLAEYLAKSPKDNGAYRAMSAAKQDIQEFGSLPVPLHFRNAPTSLMKEIGYGEGYEYDHDLTNKQSTQDCLPPELKNRQYFEKKKPNPPNPE